MGKSRSGRSRLRKYVGQHTKRVPTESRSFEIEKDRDHIASGMDRRGKGISSVSTGKRIMDRANTCHIQNGDTCVNFLAGVMALVCSMLTP